MQSIRSPMYRPPRRLQRNVVLSLTVLLALAMVLPGIIIGARADDIPHENYDLVGSNLDFVISLLRSSIRYSEGALMDMYNQSMVDVESNLTVVRGVLIPAEQLMEKIKTIAESYGNLSYLLPSFASLSEQMDSFASMEVSLIGARDTIVSSSLLANLTGEQMNAALDAIGSINSLMTTMNRTIDGMLVSANTTIALEIDGNKTFTDNQLVRLIEKLRELLYLIDIQIDYIIQNDIPWSRTESFLLLWLTDTEYYLGKTISGGGLLWIEGSFPQDHFIQLTMDGEDLTAARTSDSGKFWFSYNIPIDSSWLGFHSMKALADAPNGTLNSSSVGFTIILTPTHFGLSVSQTLLSPPEDLVALATLKDVSGDPVETDACHLILDGENITFSTDTYGEYQSSWSGFDLDYGTHQIQVFYDGELPYAPSSSERITIEVNIPTDVEITLLSNRAYQGYFLLLNGSLTCNGSTPMSGFEITLLVDDVEIGNLTTDSQGLFTYSIATDNMSIGGHKLIAAFLHREYIWRYSEDSMSFTVYAAKQGAYPFFPRIPGWGELSPPDLFPNLFIGAYAYYFWLLILLLLGATIKVMQIMNSRKKAGAKAKSQELFMIETAPMTTPPPVPSAEEFVEEIEGKERGPATPNERIIWYYQRLLAFLMRRDSLTLKASMTHWEVARILKSFGYPTNPVDSATILFEKALYSGDMLSDTDTVQMSSTLTKMISAKRTGV
jgi:hypothetical protein